ncbi:MAG: hypothetical protein ACRCYR_05100 [Phycicoccus sp.]
MLTSSVRRVGTIAITLGVLTTGVPSTAIAVEPSAGPLTAAPGAPAAWVAPASERDAAASTTDAATRWSWNFAGASLGPVAPGASFGSPALFASGDRPSLSVVATPRGRALDVRSWRGLRPGQPVQRSASMLSTDPGFWRARPWGSDHSGSTFDPGAGDFSVSVWLLPTDPAAFPRGSASVGSVSPNVVQKGRSTAAGGYWKLGLQLVHTSSGVAWAPECVLRGGTGDTVVVGRSSTQLLLTPGVGAVVTCARAGDRLGLTVTGDGRSGSSASVAGAARLDVDNAAAVSVASKPGTTDAGDAYDGLLTDLAINIG